MSTPTDQQVRTSTVPIIALVLAADPDYYAKERVEWCYQFANGQTKQAPNDQGLYKLP